MHYDALFKDVASVLVQKCVNPETNRPYTGTMLERALRDAHFAVDPKRTAKQQALEVTGPPGNAACLHSSVHGHDRECGEDCMHPQVEGAESNTVPWPHVWGGSCRPTSEAPDQHR